MDRERAKYILENCFLPDSCEKSEFKETHISWILMADNYVFKIKRPVKYSFLDFSTLEKRKHYCDEELRLNRRLEPEMYLNVLPVTENLGVDDKDTDDKIIDYTVRMKRMNNEMKMDVLLRDNNVNEKQIEALSEKIADFHNNTQIIKNAFRTQEFQENYADIEKHSNFISENLGDKAKQQVKDAVRKSFDYLNASRNFSNDRVINGFHRDCHGDLNARNIFLYDEKPIIFDCIEFNREFRQIDVLNDVAFLCVDLDFFEQQDLSQHFYKKYLQYAKMEDSPETNKLLNYYKSFRANVRAKVTLISAKNKEEKGQENDKELADAQKYINLMSEYLQNFETNDRL